MIKGIRPYATVVGYSQVRAYPRGVSAFLFFIWFGETWNSMICVIATVDLGRSFPLPHLIGVHAELRRLPQSGEGHIQTLAQPTEMR